MLPQQDAAGVKPPDGGANPKMAKQKGGPLGGANPAANSGGSAEQQVQRCPRCESLNTKFCYYNNYSLSQPRHFCKNCRRYWTRGGALRNVPVGGGCRKNKRLKHRDPSCLAALADIDVSGPSSILSSIGIPGFTPSTSSLIQELASEGHRLAFSRLGMQMLDKRFMTDNDHHPHHPPSSTTQDLFTMGGAPTSALGAFDPSYPALTYSKGDPQPLLFHPQHASEFPPFFDSINSPSSLTPTLDHLSSFTAGTPTPGHHLNAASMNNTASMDGAQLSLIHQIPINTMQASHDQDQQAMPASCSRGGSFNQEEESAEMSLRRPNKGKSIISSMSDWGQQLQGAVPAANANSADSCFFAPAQLGANDSGLWNVSWPEMHAALAGSAGAMLH